MARLIGINHVALEVGDVDEALACHVRFLEFELRRKGIATSRLRSANRGAAAYLVVMAAEPGCR